MTVLPNFKFECCRYYFICKFFAPSKTPGDVMSACGTSPDAAAAVSTDDADLRLIAASYTIQKMFQGPTRLSHNGEIVTITFADGGTEDYVFAAATGIAVRQVGTLKLGNRVAKPCPT